CCARATPGSTTPRSKYRLNRFTPEGGGQGVGGRSAALVGDCRDRVLGGLRVEVATTGERGLEVGVQVVDQRDAGGHVQPGDRGVVDAVQVLDDGAQRVAVRGHQHHLAGAQVGDHLTLPVRQGTAEHVL